MSVSLNPPSQLGFQRPLTQLVKRTLAVTNSNSQPVAFKVKTTAPKQYCVRPNSGRIEAGETIEVQVLLQPMKEDPPAGTKCRDKFLVQSVIITGDKESTSLSDLWSSVEKDGKTGDKASAIFEQKIRCSYLPPAEESATNGTASTVPDEGNSSVRNNGVGRGASEAPVTPIAASAVAPSTPANTAAPSFSTPQTGHTSTDRAKEVAAGAGGAIASAAAAVGLTKAASAVSDRASSLKTNNAEEPIQSVGSSSSAPSKDIQAELDAARAEIARLKAQLEQKETTSAALRSRGAGATASSSSGGAEAQMTEQKIQQGIPLEVVAGIAFGVFVFTWSVEYAAQAFAEK